MADRFYTDEQAQEILRMAVRTSAGSGAISRNQLLESAAELGIRPEEVIQAEQAYIEREALESDRETFRQYKRKDFFGSVSRWLGIGVLLYGIAFLSMGFQVTGLLFAWPIWPVGIMGLILVKDSIEYLFDMTFNREAVFDKWRRKRLKEVAPKSDRDLGSAVTAKIVIDIEGDQPKHNQTHA